jgi:hypothetical protein
MMRAPASESPLEPSAPVALFGDNAMSRSAGGRAFFPMTPIASITAYPALMCFTFRT